MLPVVQTAFVFRLLVPAGASSRPIFFLGFLSVCSALEPCGWLFRHLLNDGYLYHILVFFIFFIYN